MDKYSQAYWNKIRVGSIIQLDDTQTLEFLINEGKEVSSNGADFEVVRIKDISLNDDSIKLKLVYIVLDDIIWHLAVWNVEGEIKLKIYYQPDYFEFGNRSDLLERECFYLFEAPEDEENVVPEDLVFTTHWEEENAVFTSMHGVTYGTSVEAGEDDDFATVVSMTTDAELEDTDILILEFCKAEVEEQLDDEGYTIDDPIINIDSTNSWVMFLKGCSVEMNDVEVLTQGSSIMTERMMYKQLSIALVHIFTFAMSIFIGILMMVKGWGVEAKSYPWIIGGGIAVAFVTWVLQAATAAIIGVKDED